MSNGFDESTVVRDSDGRFAPINVCECCGKKAPRDDYFSDEDTCNTAGLGLVLCARKRCIAKREAMSVTERIEMYRAMRETVNAQAKR